MKRELIVLAGLALVAAGCEGMGGYDGRAAALKMEKENAKIGAPKAVYTEVPHEGRIYVVSSAKAAEGVKKGQLPATAVTKIGAGPNGETVVFEASRAFVEDELIAEWNRKHAGAVKK